MATVTFWGARELAQLDESTGNLSTSDTPTEGGSPGKGNVKKGGKSDSLHSSSLGGDAGIAGLPRIAFDFQQQFLTQDRLLDSLNEINGDSKKKSTGKNESLLNWAMLEFQIPVFCPPDSLIIGSRLDTVDNQSGSASSCRLAFSGRLIEKVNPESDISRLRLYTPKEKVGTIFRLGDPHRRTDDQRLVRYEVFGQDLFKKETNMKVFLGMKVVTNKEEVGEIKSSFGTAGRFRVVFPAGTEAREGDPLFLKFKRFAHDAAKAMHQDLALPAARPGTRLEPQKKQKKKGGGKNESLEGDPPADNGENKLNGINLTGEVVSVKGDVLENGKHNMAIISGFFSPEINVREKIGSTVMIPSTDEVGTISGPFGKAGKCKVSFENGISPSAVGAQAKLQLD